MTRLGPLLAALVVVPVNAAEPPPADHAAKMAKGLDVFKQHVRPVLVGQCLKCHGGETTESELDLSDRDRLLKGGHAGPAVVPGKSAESRLWQMVARKRKPYMPYEEDKLPDATVARIAEWIDLGAPYDKPLVARAEAAAWTQTKVPDEARGHWAFQPLQRVEPPVAKSAARTAIDRFILAKLDEKGLTPNPPAAKAQLVRRAYFDLIGLPPTPAEVDAFVKDDSPDAWERLIDKLLASPHYGERWARHWLDLARFAESHGFEHDYDRPTAYHYRDFVIKALNAGMPYDRFVKWQLAGDEYAPDDPLAMQATGFLAAGVHSTQITKNEVAKHRYDEMDDMLATAGTAFLGLTVGCARCHDHKFDPIPQADYYRMLATFTTTVRNDYDLNLDPEGYKKAKAAFDAEHAPLAAAVAAFEKEQLPGRFAAWEKDRAGQPLPAGWVLPEVASAKSAGGATVTKHEDGSLFVTGKNPPTETLTVVLHTELTGLTGIRVEALTHPSLVKHGPGRAANGNFALTDFFVTAQPKGVKDAKPAGVKLAKPRATFEQKGLAAAGAIDGDPVNSGWAIDPEFGKDHACAFVFASPVGEKGGTILTVTLKFQTNVGHGMGRPRLSLTTAGGLALDTPALPEAVVRALGTPAEKRSAEQTSVLLKWYRHIDPDWARLNDKATEHLKREPKPNLAKTLISTEGLTAVRLHTQGEDFFPQTFFLRRGDPDQKEGEARPGFLQVLTPREAEPEKRWQSVPPRGWRTSFRRRAFAEWLCDVENGAGRLLARVIVNRLWQHHLGRGIVATPSDFGLRGVPPTHPELLDWLAGELVRNGWQLKPIHKLIMSSAVYCQSSAIDPAKLAVDRENSLFWRRPVRRLEAEAIRDSLLAVGGLLDRQMYGPGTLDESMRRRSIYFTVKRSKLIPALQIFDAPEALGGVGERPTTTIAPQALLLMNNPQAREAAKGLAKRVGGKSVEEAVREAYRVTLARPATAEETADGAAFVKRQAESYQANKAELALADFCQVLLCLNEFVYLE